MALELADSLWFKVCQYLDPCDRFKLCECCSHFNGLLSRDNYPVFTFYKCDLNYWVKHIKCNVRKVAENPDDADPEASERETYTFNLNALWNCHSITNQQIRRSIKYFIIFYHQISNLGVNTRIENHCRNRMCRDVSDPNPQQFGDDEPELIVMGRLSDDEEAEEDEVDEYGHYGFSVQNDNDSNLEIDDLVTLQIDLNESNDFIPSTIEYLYLHEIPNSNDPGKLSMIHWISDIITFCDSQCGILKHLHFDESTLNDDSIAILCDALSVRSTPLLSLELLSLAWNGITSECIGRLLRVLNEQCPELKVLNLSSTRMDNAMCKEMLGFYKEYWKEHEDIPLKKLEELDLSVNSLINEDGINCIDEIFDSAEISMRIQTLKVRVAECGFSEIDVWSSNIIPYASDSEF